MKFKNEKNLLFVDFIKIYFEKKKSFIFHIVSRERERDLLLLNQWL